VYFSLKMPHPPETWKSSRYGQNVAWAHPGWNSTLTAWFDEFKPYAKAKLSPLIFRDAGDKHFLGQIAHFTAMANANSTRWDLLVLMS